MLKIGSNSNVYCASRLGTAISNKNLKKLRPTTHIKAFFIVVIFYTRFLIMILYNLTIKIETSIKADWLQWLNTELLPLLTDTGLILSYRLCRLLHPIDENDDGITYALQLFCKNEEDFNSFNSKHAGKIQQELSKTFPNKYVLFGTVLKVEDLQNLD